VHFGTQAFPSPHDGIYVEGIYVELFPTHEDNAPYDVRFKFACSDDLSLDDEDLDLPRNLQQLARGPVASYTPGEGEILAGLDIRVMIAKEPAFGAWADYLDAPARAALNAIRALAEGSVAVFDAVEEQVLEEGLLARIVRAESRERFYEMVGLLDGGIVVQYLGRAPSGCATVEF
jgi:hypothetical protein